MNGFFSTFWATHLSERAKQWIVFELLLKFMQSLTNERTSACVCTRIVPLTQNPGNHASGPENDEIIMKDFAKKIGLLLLLPCALSSTGNAQTPADIDLNQGLIGFYPFNGTTRDRSGNGNDLTSSKKDNIFGFDRNVHPNKVGFA
jgi:hypothetical protein